ncbi:complement C1q-like protein 2 [Centroberyx gerrardi]
MTSMEARLSSSESRVEALERDNADRPKVAFSAALVTSVGPLNTDTAIIYPNVITNIGNAYSPVTGVFTASVRGVYYFRFNAIDQRRNYGVSVNMLKNGIQFVMGPHMLNVSDKQFVSNGITLELDTGDFVSMSLPSGHRLQGDGNRNNIFSGFLLFPM